MWIFSWLLSPRATISDPFSVKTVGITSVSTQLLLNAIQTPVMAMAALAGLSVVHKFGRRKLLIFSSAGMTVSMAIITACTAEQAGKPAVGGTGIAFLYVFLVCFAFAWVCYFRKQTPPLSNKKEPVIDFIFEIDSYAIPLPRRGPVL